MSNPQAQEATAATAPPPDETAGQPQEAAVDDQDDLWSEALSASHNDGSGEDDPAPDAETAQPETVDDPPQPQQTAQETAKQEGAGDDIWSDVPEQARTAYQEAIAERDRLLHAERSNRGRISAMQRQIEELRSGAGDKPAQQQESKGESQASGSDAGADFLGSADWKEFAEEYPEIAKPLGHVISGLSQKAIRLEKELSAIGSDRRQAAQNEQAAILSEVHPDWVQLTEGAAFSDWLRDQPRYVQEAARRNGDGIVDGQEAADLISRFKQSIAPNGHAAPVAGNGTGAPGNNAPPLSAKRQQQLASAKSPRLTSPSAAHGLPAPNDEAAAWNYFTARR